MFFIGIGLVALFSVIHLAVSKKPRTGKQILDVVLIYVFLLSVGLSGVLACMGHLFNADKVAEQIGWPAGNPFQSEVAFANLAFGVLGIISAWKGGPFRMATGIGWAVFLMGAGLVHLRQMCVAGNNAPLNSGAMILIADFVLPVTVLVMLYLHGRLRKA